MRYMLDTNICIYLIKKKPRRVLEKLKKLAVSDVAVSAVTLAELEYGVAKSSRQEQNSEALNAFVAPLEIISFDDRAACRYGEIRAHLERQGKVIGGLDMLIAAHASSLALTLVTNNIREFERIPGLELENWV